MRIFFATSIILVTIALNTSSVFAADAKLENLWYYTETPRSRQSLNKNIGKIGILAPQTYELGIDGNIKSNMKDEVLNLAKSNKVKVMPLLANTDGKVFNQKTILDLLHNTKNWEKISKYMREEAYNNGFYGWQLDLENIPVGERQNFNDLVKYLKKEFSKDGLKLSVAVVSKTSDNKSDYAQITIKNYWENWAGVYDYKILSENVDFLSIMAYDQPNSPGPVATVSWSKKVLDYTLSIVPKEKISFGIPVYGWAYRAGSKNHFTMVDFPFTYTKITDYSKRDTKNMTTGSGTSKEYGNITWLSYNKYGKGYTIWFEDKNSFKAKLDQVKSAGVLGYSVWVLGDEDPRVWEVN